MFDDRNEAILFWTASRGHHADVGGAAPGSMTPLATTVDEEGVLFDNFKIVDQGHFRETELRDLLTDHAYPARNPHQNIADLSAQIAANEKGIQEVPQDGCQLRPRCGPSLHELCAGQRRGKRPARH